MIAIFRRDGYDSPNDPNTGYGTLQLRLSGASLTEGTTVPILVYNDVPWSSLGIPVQSKIAAVKGAYDWRCLTYSSMAGSPENHSGVMALYNASGEPVVQMVSGNPITATSAWATNQGSFVGVGDISASETLRLRIAPLLATGPSFSSVILTLHDWIQLFVRYYVPYLSAAQILGLRPTLGAPALSVPLPGCNFEAEGIDAGAVILGTPGINQINSLLSVSISSDAPVLSSPAIQQCHTFTVPGVVSGFSVLPAPQLHETNCLSVGVGIVAGQPVLSRPALMGLVYALLARGIVASAPEMGRPILGVLDMLWETFRRTCELCTRLHRASAATTLLDAASLFVTRKTGRSVLR